MLVSLFVMWRFDSTGLHSVTMSFKDTNPTRPSMVSDCLDSAYKILIFLDVVCSNLE